MFEFGEFGESTLKKIKRIKTSFHWKESKKDWSQNKIIWRSGLYFIKHIWLIIWFLLQQTTYFVKSFSSSTLYKHGWQLLHMACILGYLVKYKYKKIFAEHRHMALHINRSKHFQFCRKNVDWHLSRQYWYFTKLQGHHHVQIIPLNDYICTHTLPGLITPKYFLLLNVCAMCLTSKSYYRIVTETRATADRWTWCIYLANKNVLGLRDTYVLFFVCFKNEWMIVCVYRAVT